MARKLVDTFAPVDPLQAKTLVIEEALAELQSIDLAAIVEGLELLPDSDRKEWLSRSLKTVHGSLGRARRILLDATA